MQEYGAASGPESGQTMAEYAITLGVITLAVVGTFGLLSANVSSMMGNVIALI
jgi:Flp pilus assembly pilin Flp